MAGIADRLRPLASALERRLVARRSSRPPRWVTLLVVVALVVGAVLAARSLPEDLDEFSWWPLVLIALLTFPSMVLNAHEYALSARVSGVSVSFWAALRIALYGTAANLLPIPGASLVRIHAIRRSGGGLGRAAGVTAAVGVCWLAVSLLLAGFLLVPRGLLSLPFIGSGVVAMLLVWVFLRRAADASAARHHLVRLVLIEVGFVAAGALRLGAALVALGEPASLATSFTLGVSSAIAAATGFIPGGLGLREALVAALGPMVGVEASTAFLAAVIERIVSLAVVAVVAAIVLNLRVGRPADAPQEPHVVEG